MLEGNLFYENTISQDFGFEMLPALAHFILTVHLPERCLHEATDMRNKRLTDWSCKTTKPIPFPQALAKVSPSFLASSLLQPFHTSEAGSDGPTWEVLSGIRFPGLQVSHGWIRPSASLDTADVSV